MPDDRDPVRRGDDFAEPAALDIAAGLDREIDDDRARRQLAKHGLGQQHRRLAPGNERGADHDVDALEGLDDLVALAALKSSPISRA